MSTQTVSSKASEASPLVELTRDAYGVHGVTAVTLNRPDAFNALSEALLDELQTALTSIAASDARVVVIAGAGRAFCAGHDLKECARHRRSSTTRRCSRVARR